MHTRIWVVVAILVTVARLVSADAAGTRDDRPAAAVSAHDESSVRPTARSLQDSAPPCGAAAQRSLDPLVLPQETDLTVTTRIGFDCPAGQRKVNLVLLQNGEMLASPGPGEDQLNLNLIRAMRAFVRSVDPAIGSRGGYIVFSSAATEQFGLTPFSEWPDTWGAPVSSALATAGLLPAMQAAALQLASDPHADGAENIMLIVLAGTEPIGTSAERDAACRAVESVGARVAAVSMYGPSNNGTLHDFPCIDWLIRSAEVDGADLDQAFDQVRATVLEHPQVTSVVVNENLTNAFEYVNGSGAPRDPDLRFGGELTWTFDAPAPGEFRAAYRVRANPGVADVLARVSSQATTSFYFSNGEEAHITLANPTVCIHQRRSTEFCDRHAPTPLYLPALQR